MHSQPQANLYPVENTKRNIGMGSEEKYLSVFLHVFFTLSTEFPLVLAPFSAASFYLISTEIC